MPKNDSDESKVQAACEAGQLESVATEADFARLTDAARATFEGAGQGVFDLAVAAAKNANSKLGEAELDSAIDEALDWARDN